MSDSYASRLSHYENKGICGEAELAEASEHVLEEKCLLLSQWVKEAAHAVVYTGAGISTSAGIPDFRGPDGVWTREACGGAAPLSVNFHDAIPTLTHMSITALASAGIVKRVVSQNVDGLHLRSGLAREQLAELHGNVFMEKCEKCGVEAIRENESQTVGLKLTGQHCSDCRGDHFRDTLLDWEDALPPAELSRAEKASAASDLSICLGTSLKIRPASEMPLNVKRRRTRPRGRLVICNLQETPKDKLADLIIRARVDDVMRRVMKHLHLPIPNFTRRVDTMVGLVVAPHKARPGTRVFIKIKANDDTHKPSPFVKAAFAKIVTEKEGREIHPETPFKSDSELELTVVEWPTVPCVVAVTIVPSSGKPVLLRLSARKCVKMSFEPVHLYAQTKEYNET